MAKNMEGVERRLHEKTERIEGAAPEKARRDSAVADIPYEVEANVTPPRALLKVLDGPSAGICGQRFALTWESGQWKGLPVTGYCCEPLCVNTGECTGTRFVPHIDQWDNGDSYNRKRRTLTPQETLAAVRMFAHKAAAQTGRDEERTDKEILAHVKLVWQRTISQIKEQGKWRR